MQSSWHRTNSKLLLLLCQRVCEPFSVRQSKVAMFALVNKAWTKKLADELSRLGISRGLEVCAGRGYLSKALTEHGIYVISTDIAEHQKSFFDVEKIGA